MTDYSFCNKMIRILCLAAGLCLVGITGTAAGQISSDAPGVSTTMDSLEAHVWMMEENWDPYGHILTYKMFRGDTIFTRIRTNGEWGHLFFEPFYLFKPGQEFYDIVSVNGREEYVKHLWPDVLGANQNGRHIAYRYNILGFPTGHVWASYTNVASVDIVTLTDSTLNLKETSYFKPLITLPLEFHYTASDLPFPWDENLYLYGSARPYRQQIREAKRKVREQYGRNKKL